MFDGGYYPQGGMQDFADTLLKRFTELRGVGLFSNKIKKIIVEKNEVRGVAVNGRTISTKYIISACDARQTFFELIGENKVEPAIIDRLKSMISSTSVFLVYLGLDKFIDGVSKLRSNLYILNDVEENNLYQSMLSDRNAHFAITSSAMRSEILSDKPSLCIATNAMYRDSGYWNLEAKNKFADSLVSSAERVIPGLTSHVVFRGIATPVTMRYWTANFNGAAYGWASTPEQFGDPITSQRTKIRNLYLTGHWSNLSSGISLVANCGALTADLVVRDKEKNK
jgi:phytoene dehydrogenase-like protein